MIARTFSKIHGMAGMRVGYAIAQEKTLAAMREHHSASGISVMSFAAAAASLADAAAMQRNQLLNRQTRALTVAAFEKAGLQGGGVAGELRHGGRAARRPPLHRGRAAQKGVYIGRPFPPLTNWARITVGTQAEMDQRAADHARCPEGAGPTSASMQPLPESTPPGVEAQHDGTRHGGSFSSASRAPPVPR